MKWLGVVKSKTLLINDSEIDFETFEFLTGKHIELEKRAGKRIILTKTGGHLYISDESFIEDETYYIKDGLLVKHPMIYKCITIDKNNNALLSPVDKSFSVLTIPNVAYSWIIYTKGKK